MQIMHSILNINSDDMRQVLLRQFIFKAGIRFSVIRQSHVQIMDDESTKKIKA